MVVSPAIAQSNFAGFYGKISTGYESNTASGLNSPLTISAGGSSATLGSASAYNQKFGGMPLVGGLGYYYSIDPRWLVGIGGDYSFLSQESSSYSYSLLGSGVPSGVGLAGAKIKTSNRFNIFITPGYAIDQDKLVYLKGGYTSVQVDVTAPSTVTLGGESASLAGITSNQTKTLNGYILGLGYKQIINGGFYGFGEENYMNYNNANFGKTSSISGFNISTNTSSHLTSYQILVGLGYKF